MAVCNNDRTLTQISKSQIPFSDTRMVGFCNGIFCLQNSRNHIIYLWNPSIRKFKMLDDTCLTHTFESRFTRPFARVAAGLAYQSRNNDFKILRIVCYNKMSDRIVFYNNESGREQVLPAEAEVYSLSTNSWREVELNGAGPNIGSIDYNASSSSCLYFNGALHLLAFSRDHHFILSFDVDNERFREIMLPQNYLDATREHYGCLAVFKGLLAFVAWDEDPGADRDICHIWVMREYGVAESWTKKSIPVDSVSTFFCCTDSGELLIQTVDKGLNSYDPESLNKNRLDIRHPLWLGYTTSHMESLVLLEQVKIPSKYED